MAIESGDTQKQPYGAKGVYLYCFAPAAGLPPLKIPGVDTGDPVTQQAYKDVVAVTSRINVADFSGPAGETNLKNLEWVGPRALRHQKVVEAVMQHAPVLPARFGTIFSSSRPMLALCVRHYGVISEFLRKVATKTEWAVKGYLDRQRARHALKPDLAAGNDERLADVSPGKQYFMQKQMASEFEQQINQQLKTILSTVFNELTPYTADFRELKVLSRKSTGLDMDMVLNWSFLVSRDLQENFAAHLKKIQHTQEKNGLRFDLSGPWPPYSFCPSLNVA
ncbi:MAG: GvpL/GvpF family gas vesicle protein [Desulfobacterales bacterium]|nr:GvpL/GvpF family gas vesicle protein [Desulfobacterales bacterium]